jgi:pimeloyl-ACP methyl ester carboxylesterase
VSEKEGIVFILDGAGASGFTPLVLKRSLAELPYEVQTFRWGTGYMRIISDLTNRENIQRKSDELTHSIQQYKIKNETHRIYVIAKSAGTVVALRALSQLPEHTVEKAILLSPAVSPQFPLSDALRAVRHELVSFWSPIDLFFLGFGTSVFGTADGVHTRGAGLVGFRIPEDGAATEAEYSKLRQIKWDPSMIKLMHLGDHSGNSMPPFVRRHIVPLLSPTALGSHSAESSKTI